MYVYVSHTPGAGSGDARRLIGALQTQLGPDQVLGSTGEAQPATNSDQLVARSEASVALIGEGWSAAEDRFAHEVGVALGRRIPVIVVLGRGATLPPRESLPAALKPLHDHHPALTLEIPTDFYWDVWAARLARWLLRIDEERRRRLKVREDSQNTRVKLEQDVARTRQQVTEAEAAVNDSATKRDAADAAVRTAADVVARRQADVDPARAGGGARVFLSYGTETSGDARKLESDLKERLERVVVYSTEPIPEGADARATIADRIGRCDLVLAVLGPAWLAAPDGADGPPAPAPRLEVQEALRRGIAVIPVLTPSASRPAREALPDDLKGLADRPAVELLIQFWTEGVDDLIARIRQTEQELQRRDRSLQEASDQLRAAEREASRARTANDKALTDLERARGRVAELEQQLTRAREEEERVGQERDDQNRAFLDGPPPMQAQSPQRLRLSPQGLQLSPQMIAVAIAIVVVLIIIIAVAH